MRGRRGGSESYLDIAVEAAAHLRAYRVYALDRKFLCILRAVLAEDNRVLLRHDARDEHRAAERAEPLALTDMETTCLMLFLAVRGNAGGTKCGTETV